jgi:gliding motility-associated-like protein
LDGVNFQSSGAFSGLGAGSYTVTVRDANGCTGQQAVLLSSSAAPTVGLSNVAQPACGQSNGSFTAQGSGGASPYQYSLDGVNFQSSGAFSGLGAGSYTVTVRDANGCTGQQAVLLSSSAAPTVGLSNVVQPACGQSNGSFTAQGSGGASPYQYSLDGVNFQSSGAFSGLGAGSYTVTVRDANGCTGQQATTLNNSSNLIITLTESTAPDCKNDNGTIRVSAQGGSPIYVFSIDGTNFQANPLFDGLGPGQYIVYCRDNQGCISTLEVTLEDPLAGLTAAQATTPTSIICFGEAFNLTANLPAGTTGVWSVDRGGMTITSPLSPESSAIISEAGNYALTWTLSTADCDGYSSASVALTVVPAPVAQQDGPIPVSGQGVEILILGNDVHLPDATISILQAPSQGVATLNGNSINYTPDLDAAGADTLIYQICQPDCELLCDTAMVVVINTDGSDICDLEAAPDNVFPEGITPNGDGFNDQLEFIVVDPTSCPFNFANSELIIFNRWGDRVFEAAPYNNDWDGRSPNGALPAGVYYYVLKVKLEQEFVRFGNISIFR